MFWWRRESNPRPKSNFCYKFKLLAGIELFSGTAWGLTCQNLNFHQATSNSTYPLAILTYASVNILGDMFTRKVKKYAGHLHFLGMVHDFKWIGLFCLALSTYQ
jgi:hypothetical protein